MNTTGPRSGTATTTTTGMNVQRITARLRITARRTDTRRTATISRLFPIPTLSQQLPVQPRRSIIAPAYAALREQKPLKTEMLLATAGAVGRATGTVRTPASVKIVTMKRQKIVPAAPLPVRNGRSVPPAAMSTERLENMP